MASICRTIRRSIGLQYRGNGGSYGNNIPNDQKDIKKLNRAEKRKLRKEAIIRKRTRNKVL